MCSLPRGEPLRSKHQSLTTKKRLETIENKRLSFISLPSVFTAGDADLWHHRGYFLTMAGDIARLIFTGLAVRLVAGTVRFKTCLATPLNILILSIFRPGVSISGRFEVYRPKTIRVKVDRRCCLCGTLDGDSIWPRRNYPTRWLIYPSNVLCAWVSPLLPGDVKSWSHLNDITFSPHH